MNRIVTLLLLLCATAGWAQKYNVSGVVKGPEGVIPNVSVREIDANHRVYGHTTTDQGGLFTFRVRDIRNSLQFYAPGYRTFTHKMLGKASFRVTMEKRRTSPYVATAKVILRSDHLICGHYNGDEVRMQAWVEQMNDTLFALILPVEMDKVVDEYAAGRKLTVLDNLGHTVMLLENVVDAYPVAGDPDEVSERCLAQSYTGMNHIPGVGEGDARLYAYPHFQITRSQIKELCNNLDLVDRFAVDTYRADNFWNVFPTSRTAALLEKVLNKK